MHFEAGGERTWQPLAEATSTQYDLGRVCTVAFSPDGSTMLIRCEEISGK